MRLHDHPSKLRFSVSPNATIKFNARSASLCTAAPPRRAIYTVAMSAAEQSSSGDAKPLAAWTIVVTRPRDSVTPLIRGLRRHGAQVLRLPAQAILANDQFNWPAALADCDRVDEWIFTSPSSVSHAKLLLERGLTGSHVFAVGSGTALALRRHGCTAIAPDRHHNSEAMLDLSGLSEVNGRRIVIVTAPGGRGLIASSLRERGAEVIEWPVYRRQAVVWSKPQLGTLSSANDPLLTIISSGEVLDILATTLPEALWQRLRDGRWITSSQRLEAALRQRGATRIDRAASALSGDLINAALALR